MTAIVPQAVVTNNRLGIKWLPCHIQIVPSYTDERNILKGRCIANTDSMGPTFRALALRQRETENK